MPSKLESVLHPTIGHLAAEVILCLAAAITGKTVQEWVEFGVKNIPYVAIQIVKYTFYSAAIVFFVIATCIVIYCVYARYGKSMLPRIFIYAAMLVGVWFLTSSMTSYSRACETVIDRPENKSSITRLFNIIGHGQDPESCPYVQVWIRDLGRAGGWVLADEIVARTDSSWGSRYLDPDKFNGPEVEIRAVGWRVPFGNDKSNPPLSYLARTKSVTITVGG